jgi:hypothetical protein
MILWDEDDPQRRPTAGDLPRWRVLVDVVWFAATTWLWVVALSVLGGGR